MVRLLHWRSRLRAKVVQSLVDLAFIAERKPEDQLAQIFTPTSVNPLLQAPAGHGCYQISSRHYDMAKIMLDASMNRLQALIGSDYRSIVVPSLEKDLNLLRTLPMPTTPREGSEKRPPDAVKVQREQAQKKRRSISEEFVRNQLL